jgi:plasmid stability protein
MHRFMLSTTMSKQCTTKVSHSWCFGELDSMPTARHIHAMANLQVKNIPHALHQRLRRYAREHKCTLSEVVLNALERELVRREWHERLAQRPTTDLGASAASLLAQERQQREQEPR